MRIGYLFSTGMIAAILAGWTVANPARAYDIIDVNDGSLADWGATVADNNASDFSAGSLKTTIGLMGSFAEDQDDNAGDSSFLGPNYGGQNYDAEFMAVAVQNGTMYIAIASGVRPDNGFRRYAPGDIRIETMATSGGPVVDVFGVEVGGGTGGELASSGVLTEGAAGSTYHLYSSGYTQAVSGSTDPAQTVGSVWKNPAWIDDPIASPIWQTQIDAKNGGTKVGMAGDYSYSRDTVTDQHSIIELALDLSLLDNPQYLSIYWWPSCGNDVVMVLDVDRPTVPEPQTLFVFALGLGGLIFLRRRARA